MKVGLVWFFVVTQMFHGDVEALNQGRVEKWIIDHICNGRTGLFPVPWDCTGFLYCTRRISNDGAWFEANWFPCPYLTEFDPTVGTCSQPKGACSRMRDIAYEWCPKYPMLKFAHPESCAMFYDCSQKNVLTKYELNMYENECSYPNVFDPDTTDCRPAADVVCSNKPLSKCSYKTECLSTSAECEGKPDGLSPKLGTLFTADYIRCEGGQLKESGKCTTGQVLNPSSGKCTRNIERAVETFCDASKNRLAKFADPTHCARYYDCSKKIHYFGLHLYQSECKYMYLYEPKVQSCVKYDQIETPCGTRFEPKEPCSYKVGHCVDRLYCILCDASCLGMKDGLNPYPSYPNTRFHLKCKDGRTTATLQCPPGNVFSDQRKGCVPDGSEITTSKTTPTTTATTSATTTAATTTATTRTPTSTTITTTITTASTTTTATTTATTKPTTPPAPITAPPPPDVCTCLEELDMLTDSLQNVTSLVNIIATEMKAPGPYSCDRPELVANTKVSLHYESHTRVAKYTCKDGYTLCTDSLTAVCNRNNMWVPAIVETCKKSTWTQDNHLEFPCGPGPDTSVVVRGRPVEDLYHLILENHDTGAVFLRVRADPSTDKVYIGEKVIDSPVSLAGEQEWTINTHETFYEILINGKTLANIPHNDNLADIDSMEVHNGFHVEDAQFQRDRNSAPSASKRNSEKGRNENNGKEKRKIFDPLSGNLAHKMTTKASSHFRLADSDRATDGFSYLKWEDNSCWSSEGSDSKPWWMLDLGKTFYVTHVVIISVDCPHGCRNNAKQFVIELYDEDPTVGSNPAAQHCNTYATSGSPVLREIKCSSPVTGRYLLIKSGVNQILTLCEVEVYGGLVIEEAWTPFSCPNPPLVDGTSVSLSYTKTMAIATYTCTGTDYVCPGEETIHCLGEKGWFSKPGSCHKLVLDAPLSELPSFPICPLALGSGIELWATPQGDQGAISIHDDEDVILQIELRLNEALPLSLYHTVNWTKSDVHYPATQPFVLREEAHIIITALTDYVLIEVNNEPLFKYPTKSTNIHKAISVTPSGALSIRRAKLHPQMMPDIEKERVAGNLALKAAVSSSSKYDNPASYGADGDLTAGGSFGSCWNADIGDPSQWFQVDLGKQYFVREIRIDLSNLCLECERKNLALNQKAYGSDNRIGIISSPTNVVDGSLDPMPDSGKSCYTMRKSANGEQWWMVDLGQASVVSKVAIQRRGDGKPNHLADMSVLIYENNPTSNANEKAKVCAEKAGPFRAFEKLHCDSPTTGRFVRIERMMNSSIQGDITLCEVEVYSAIESKLHDISAYVYTENPVTDKDTGGKLCTNVKGELPTGTKNTLSCKEGVWGRYVRVQADDIKHRFDQMTICELEVYGDKAVKRKWTPRDCPVPPVSENMKSRIEYKMDEAIAILRCEDGFSMCSGPSTLRCISEEGWIGQPGLCLRSSFYAPTDKGITGAEFCPLKVGESLEVFFTPTVMELNIFSLGEKSDDGSLRVIVEIGLDVELGEVALVVPQEGKKHYFDGMTFHLSEEEKVMITVLTDHIEIDLSGKKCYFQSESSHHITHFLKSDTGITRQLTVLPAGVVPTLIVKHPENLAKSRTASSSSSSNTNDNPPSLVVDGDKTMVWTNKCWAPEENDMKPWWQVEFEHEYFVSQVEITNRIDCGTPCNHHLRNFVIELFSSSPESGINGQLCMRYESEFPFGKTLRLSCTERAVGRILRLTASNMFTLCELEVYGGRIVTDGFHGDTRNVALYRPSASSSDSMIGNLELPPKFANDGNKNYMLFGRSCWAAAEGDRMPWWQVELEHFYFVSHLVITSRRCPAQCNNFLHDFFVEMYHEEPRSGSFREICFKYDGIIPGGNTETVVCKKRTLARYVRIQAVPRFNDKDVFTMCEVAVHGGKATIGESSSKNLAQKRPVKASTRYVPPERVVDGNKRMEWSGNSCWESKPEDLNPWWMVELDGIYVISEVEITSRSNCGAECNRRLHDFQIQVFIEEPDFEQEGQLCYNHKGIFPHQSTKSLKCDSQVIGRYIRLISYGRQYDDRLMLCEVEVHGLKVNDAWSPLSCPEPPSIPNACVDVCHKDDHAIATYTCNTNYSMCTGSSVLYCNGEAGWEGSPGACMLTTMQMHPGHNGDLRDFPICPLVLGEGIELWVIPEESGASFSLIVDDGESRSLTMIITPENTQEPGTIHSTVRGQVMQIEKVAGPFVLGKESHVEIVFLSEELLVKVDGQKLIVYPHIANIPRTYYVTSTDRLLIKLVKPIKRYLDGVIRSKVNENIAEIRRATADSYAENFHPRVVTDGDLSQNGNLGHCWHSRTATAKQWIKINLDYYFFIKEVILFSRAEIDFDRNHDFVIDVLPTENIDDLTMRCAFYEGEMPNGAVERIRCKEDVWGMYVQISNTFVTGDTDFMTFCEIQIHGDSVMQDRGYSVISNGINVSNMGDIGIPIQIAWLHKINKIHHPTVKEVLNSEDQPSIIVGR